MVAVDGLRGGRADNKKIILYCAAAAAVGVTRRCIPHTYMYIFMSGKNIL